MSTVSVWDEVLSSDDPPHFLEGGGEFRTGEGSREGVVADGHHLLCVLHVHLAMGKGPHHEDNRVTAGHQLSHITDNWDGERSANFHTSNWEVI